MSENRIVSSPKTLTKRQLGWVLGGCLILVAVVFIASNPKPAFLIGSTAVENEPQVDPLPVNVAPLEFVNSIEQSRAYIGTIRARLRSELGFEIGGKIKSVSVDEGDRVEPGQVLAELDTETLQAQQEATAARLAQSKSVLDELNAGPRMETIKAARAAVAAAQSQYDNATLNLTRRKRLRDEGAISTEEYDSASFSAKTAQANLDAAKEQLSELESGTRTEKIAAQASVVRQLESAAKEIEVAISKSKLVAPFAGTVTRRFLDPGSIAQSSSPVIKLVEQERLEAWIGLPVSIATNLAIGSEHQILVEGQALLGTVSAKIQELDPATRTQTVLFQLEPASSGQAVSGQLCEIQITSTVETSGFWIPNSALTKGVRGLWSVMTLQPDETGSGFRAQRQDVEVIKTGSGRVLAQGTIEDGDRVIINGVHRIADGQRVVPTDP